MTPDTEMDLFTLPVKNAEAKEDPSLPRCFMRSSNQGVKILEDDPVLFLVHQNGAVPVALGPAQSE